MTPDELAQSIADHFKPPYSAEEFQYVRDENGKFVRDEDGFRKVVYTTREFRETVDGAAMISFRTWTHEDGADISVRSLTWREIAAAVLEHYSVQPLNTDADL